MDDKQRLRLESMERRLKDIDETLTSIHTILVIFLLIVIAVIVSLFANMLFSMMY